MHFEIRVDDSSNLREKALLVRHSSGQLRDFFAWALEFIFAHSVDAYKNAQVRKVVLDTVASIIPPAESMTADFFRLAERPPGAANAPAADTSSEGDDETGSNSNDGGGNSAEGHTGSQPEQGANPEPTAPGAEGEKKPQGRAEARPERYLFHDLRLPGHPERIQQLLKECRSLELAQFSGVACVMVRVVVELSVSTPRVLQLTGASEGASLRTKIIGMLKYLDPQIEHPRNRDPELAQAYLEAEELGVQYLNGFVHNSQVYPDQHLARRFSSAFRPLLMRLDGVL